MLPSSRFPSSRLCQILLGSNLLLKLKVPANLLAGKSKEAFHAQAYWSCICLDLQSSFVDYYDQYVAEERLLISVPVYHQTKIVRLCILSSFHFLSNIIFFSGTNLRFGVVDKAGGVFIVQLRFFHRSSSIPLCASTLP